MAKTVKPGEIIEILIKIKDSYRETLTKQEIEALNYACNIIQKKSKEDKK